jgi:pimeloyl-ACP methyl ester carboxylesterase
MRGEDLTNPVIVVIHGGPGTNMAYYSYRWQSALERDYTVVHYDQRGCANTYFYSHEDAEKPTLDLLLGDLDALVDFLLDEYEKENVILVGHAWGGLLGGFYAETHPEKVAALVMVSQITDLGGTAEITANDALAYFAGPEAIPALKRLTPGLFSPYMTYYEFRWLATALFEAEKIVAINSELSGLLSSSEGSPFLGYELKYDMPVTFMMGANAPHGFADIYYELMNAPQKEFVIIENAGDNPFLDQPDTVAAVLLRVLGSNLSSD